MAGAFRTVGRISIGTLETDRTGKAKDRQLQFLVTSPARKWAWGLRGFDPGNPVSALRSLCCAVPGTPSETGAPFPIKLPGMPYGHFFWTEPAYGSFFPYGQFLLAGGRIWPYATRICSTNC